MTAPLINPGDLVEIHAPAIRSGTVGRIVNRKYFTGRKFTVFLVWIPANDEYYEISEKHLKKIERTGKEGRTANRAAK